MKKSSSSSTSTAAWQAHHFLSCPKKKKGFHSSLVAQHVFLSAPKKQILSAQNSSKQKKQTWASTAAWLRSLTVAVDTGTRSSMKKVSHSPLRNAKSVKRDLVYSQKRPTMIGTPERGGIFAKEPRKARSGALPVVPILRHLECTKCQKRPSI